LAPFIIDIQYVETLRWKKFLARKKVVNLGMAPVEKNTVPLQSAPAANAGQPPVTPGNNEPIQRPFVNTSTERALKETR